MVREQVLFAASIAQNIAYGAIGAKARCPIVLLAPYVASQWQLCLIKFRPSFPGDAKMGILARRAREKLTSPAPEIFGTS